VNFVGIRSPDDIGNFVFMGFFVIFHNFGVFLCNIIFFNFAPSVKVFYSFPQSLRKIAPSN
jgi:hypothetical protein